MKIVNIVVALTLASACGFAQQPSAPPAAKSDKYARPTAQTQPVTGKTGQRGAAINTSTTGSTGVETPGWQTDSGIAQQPGKHTSVKQPPRNPQPRPGAPPNWEQAGQEPNLADINAAAASRAEVGGPLGTLGVKGASSPAAQTQKTTGPAPKKAGAAGANTQQQPK